LTQSLMFKISLEAANTIFRLSNFGLLLSTVFVVVTTAGIFWSGSIRERFADERITKGEATVAEATKEIAIARAEAATANSVAKQAESKLADANARAEEAKRQAAEANARSEEAKKDSADSLLRAAEAEKQVASAKERAAEATLALEKFKAPRTLSTEQRNVLRLRSDIGQVRCSPTLWFPMRKPRLCFAPCEPFSWREAGSSLIRTPATSPLTVLG